MIFTNGTYCRSDDALPYLPPTAKCFNVKLAIIAMSFAAIIAMHYFNTT